MFIGSCNLKKKICDVQKKELEALIKRFRSAAKASTFALSAFELFTCTIPIKMKYVLVSPFHFVIKSCTPKRKKCLGSYRDDKLS